MKSFAIVCFLILISILQVSLAPLLAIKGQLPDFVLVFGLFLVFVQGFKRAWPGLILAGFLMDFFSGLAFGLVMISLILSIYIIDLVKGKIFSEVRFLVAPVLILFASSAYNFILIALARIFGSDLSFSISSFAIELAYNIALAIVVYGLILFLKLYKHGI